MTVVTGIKPILLINSGKQFKLAKVVCAKVCGWAGTYRENTFSSVDMSTC